MCIYFIGQPDQFVPHSCYFRLVGEREDVWRRMARPADYVARRYLYSNFGRNVAAVMRRPNWVFDNDPRDNNPDMDARLADGLLCGQVIYDRFQSDYQSAFDEPEDITYVVRTIDDYFELTYRRPANERSAYLVSQEIWTPPEGWQDHAMAYKRNHSWWHVYTDEFDVEEDDRYFQIFFKRQARMLVVQSPTGGSIESSSRHRDDIHHRFKHDQTSLCAVQKETILERLSETVGPRLVTRYNPILDRRGVCQSHVIHGYADTPNQM